MNTIKHTHDMPSWYDRFMSNWLHGPDHPFKLRMIHAIIRNIRHGDITIRVSGCNLKVNYHDFIGNSLIFKRDFEPHSIALVRSLLAPGSIFLDVGANIGLFSLCASDDPKVQVIAIEPDERNSLYLKENIKPNRRENIIFCNVLISEKIHLMPFVLPFEGNWGSARIVTEGSWEGMTAWKMAVRIADIVYELKLRDIDVLKIDVEGHELQVLQSLDWEAGPVPKNIICEYVDQDISTQYYPKESIIEFLKYKGYEALDIQGAPYTSDVQPLEYNLWFRLKPQ